jgi:hypothetical protein
VRTLHRLYTDGGGARALWRGWVPNCQRAALVNLADMATYDHVKQYVLRNTWLPDDWRTHVCASVASGLTAALVSTPADVVKTRIMNQPVDSTGRCTAHTFTCRSHTTTQRSRIQIITRLSSRYSAWRGLLRAVQGFRAHLGAHGTVGVDILGGVRTDTTGDWRNQLLTPRVTSRLSLH